MDDYTMGEYWRDVKPILKQINQEKREKNYDKRIEYAINKFKENNIQYKLCNETNGHFNLLKDNKVVMSFWSWTGKCYIPSTGFSDNIGINNTIKKFKKLNGEKKDGRL